MRINKLLVKFYLNAMRLSLKLLVSTACLSASVYAANPLIFDAILTERQSNYLQQLSGPNKLHPPDFFDLNSYSFSLPTCRTVIQNISSSNLYPAFLNLLYFGTHDDLTMIRSIVSNLTDPRAFDAARVLNQSPLRKDRDIARPLLLSVLQDLDNINAYWAATELWNNRGSADMAIARPILIAIAQDPINPHSYCAARDLWLSFSSANQAIAHPIIRARAQDPNNQDALDAAILLWSHGSGSQEDKKIAHPILLSTALNTGHKTAFEFPG